MFALVRSSDDFLRKRKVDDLKSGYFQKYNADAEITVISAKKYFSGLLLENLSPSLVNEFPIVIVENAEDGDDLFIADVEKLLNKADEFSNSYAIFEHHGGVKGQKIANLFKKNVGAQIIFDDIKPLKYDNEKTIFVQKEAQIHKKKINPLNAQKLINYIGDDIAELASTIEQISFSLNESQIEIVESNIDEIFNGSRQVDLWKFTDIAFSSKTADAFRLYRILMNNDSSGGIIILLCNIFTKRVEQLIKIYDMQQNRKKPSDYGLNDWSVRQMSQTLNRWSSDKFVQALTLLSQIDYMSKNDSIDKGKISFECLLRLL